MTVHDLHDAIGLLDEDLLEQTDRLRTAPRKRVVPLRRYWAAAACLVMLLGGTLAYWFINNALRCGSAAPAQFSAKSTPIENAAMDAASVAQTPMEEASPEEVPASGERATATAGASDQGAPDQPPVLTVGDVMLTSGNYTWTVDQGDGTAQTVTACGAHPMDDPENLPILWGGMQNVTLDWAAAPDSVTVRCWKMGENTAQKAAYEDGALTLNPGDWVYEVQAEFDRGEALYAFRWVWE